MNTEPTRTLTLYRIAFNRRDAETTAEQLRRQGFTVSLSKHDPRRRRSDWIVSASKPWAESNAFERAEVSYRLGAALQDRNA